jgi:hypothetical protein
MSTWITSIWAALLNASPVARISGGLANSECQFYYLTVSSGMPDKNAVTDLAPAQVKPL